MKLRKSGMFSIAGALALMLVVTTVVSSQPTIDEGDKAEQTAERVLDQNSYWPLGVDDQRFTISGFNLDRRYAMNGSGEFLDVVFYVNNNTSTPVKLLAFVIAFNETDGVDHPARGLIPYPQWRNRDYDAEKSVVHYLRMSPQDVPEKAIWGYKDPDYFKTAKHLARQRNSITGNRPIPDLLPPLWKYIEYISYKPSVFLPFTLYGDVGPTDDKRVESNYVRPTETERDTKVFRNIEKHTYTLENDRRRTIVRTFHFSKFRADYKYFNKVAVVIMDQDRVEAWKEQRNRELQPGEERVEPVVYKKIMTMTKPLKHY